MRQSRRPGVRAPGERLSRVAIPRFAELELALGAALPMHDPRPDRGKPGPESGAKPKAACADPDGSCFGVFASMAAVDLRALRASANAAGRSRGAGDRHHRDVADAVARRSRCRATVTSC